MLDHLATFIDAELRMLPIFALYFVGERLFGVRKLDVRAWLFDWEYWFVWVLLNSLVLALFAVGGYNAIRDWAGHHRLILHLGTLHPVAKQLILLFAFDLLYYWFHRTQHTTALWPQHAIHHSEPHLNAATAFRHHVLENAVKVPLIDIPLMFIFVETVWGHQSILTQLATGFITYLGVFAHSNMRIGFGPLNWVLVSPQTHRIHHSVEEPHWNRNFAAYFPVIDVIFGTYYHPRPGEFPDTGIPGVGFALNSLPAALAHPFREWASMVRDRKVRRDGIAPHARLAGDKAGDGLVDRVSG